MFFDRFMVIHRIENSSEQKHQRKMIDRSEFGYFVAKIVTCRIGW